MVNRRRFFAAAIQDISVDLSRGKPTTGPYWIQARAKDGSIRTPGYVAGTGQRGVPASAAISTGHITRPST
jgi:hypothetical protein